MLANMPLDPQSLYVQLGRLIETMPPLTAPLTAEDHQWLGRASALIADTGNVLDMVELTTAIDFLETINHSMSVHKVKAVLYRALSKAELAAPVAARGAFIPVGADFDAFAAIGKVLAEARSDVLIIDPYLDETVLRDFVGSAPDGVRVRLLSDRHSYKSTLEPAARRWAGQYGANRPVEVRLTAPRLLHDRLIIIDGSKVWSLTQSFRDIAARSPASIVRVDDTASLKITAYEQMWQAATPL